MTLPIVMPPPAQDEQPLSMVLPLIGKPSTTSQLMHGSQQETVPHPQLLVAPPHPQLFAPEQFGLWRVAPH
tara:strand:+ start:271 stop:483 length:213 start_codon:yes stop_codon:yes gene_type:complete